MQKLPFPINRMEDYMNIKLAPTLRHYDKKNLSKDIVAGIIIMAVPKCSAWYK